MKNPNEEVADAFIRHQIYLLKHAGWWTGRVVRFLQVAEAAFLKEYDRESKKSDDKRRERLYKALEKYKKTSWEKIISFSGRTESDLIKYERRYNETTFVTALPVIVDFGLPPIQRLVELVRDKPFGGKILREWLSQLRVADVARLKSLIDVGLLEGRSVQQMSADMAGIRALTARDAESIVRTAVSNIASNVRLSIIKANSDLIEEVDFVATLDSRTTLTCMGLDGQRFPLKKAPQLPLHFQCRSILVPVFLANVLAERPAKTASLQEILADFKKERGIPWLKSYRDIPHGMKTDWTEYRRRKIRESIERVPGTTTYQQFLSRQSRAFQEEVLGKKRAILFREGGLPLDRFIDNKGVVLTLDQLRKREKTLFNKAFKVR